jgi:hypothetical protein
MLSGEFESLFENKRLGTDKEGWGPRCASPVGPFDTIDEGADVFAITPERPPCRKTPSAREGHPAVSLSYVYDRYINDPTLIRSAQTMLAHANSRKVAEEVLGASRPIADVSREYCRRPFETLRSLPTKYSKNYRALTIHDAVERARRDHKIKTTNITNIKAYIARFGSMLNWAVSEDYSDRNPSRGLKLAETGRP